MGNQKNVQREKYVIFEGLKEELKLNLNVKDSIMTLTHSETILFSQGRPFENVDQKYPKEQRTVKRLEIDLTVHVIPKIVTKISNVVANLQLPPRSKLQQRTQQPVMLP